MISNEQNGENLPQKGKNLIFAVGKNVFTTKTTQKMNKSTCLKNYKKVKITIKSYLKTCIYGYYNLMQRAGL